MKPLALLGTVIGVAMILVWWDAATMLHRASSAGIHHLARGNRSCANNHQA